MMFLSVVKALEVEVETTSLIVLMALERSRSAQTAELPSRKNFVVVVFRVVIQKGALALLNKH